MVLVVLVGERPPPVAPLFYSGGAEGKMSVGRKQRQAARKSHWRSGNALERATGA
jgi:hypothetical protein